MSVKCCLLKTKRSRNYQAAFIRKPLTDTRVYCGPVETHTSWTGQHKTLWDGGREPTCHEIPSLTVGLDTRYKTTHDQPNYNLGIACLFLPRSQAPSGWFIIGWVQIFDKEIAADSKPITFLLSDITLGKHSWIFSLSFLKLLSGSCYKNNEEPDREDMVDRVLEFLTSYRATINVGSGAQPIGRDFVSIIH